MANLIFLALLTLFSAGVLTWGIRTLPRERWQMIAAVPLHKRDDGHWDALNLTYYGFFSASAYAFGAIAVLLLAASAGIAPRISGTLLALVLCICAPASKLIARMVEKKRHTFTIGGASFLGILLMPVLFVAAKVFLLVLAPDAAASFSVMPLLAAAAIAYTFGEGFGRLACLSFGCCYGMPVRQARVMSSPLIRFFANYALIFEGETKKTAYESCLAGEPLIPVQAITAVLYCATGVAATALFLSSHYAYATLVAITITQGWRAYSEFLRADFRGHHRFSAYQRMSLIGLAYTFAAVALLNTSLIRASLHMPTGSLPTPQIADGLAIFSSPLLLVAIQLLWAIMFLWIGRSSVTGSNISFFVHRERV
ncbi:MAG: hypothetical protein ACYC46_07575 [Acidobacteriaceae bacterium]